MPLWTSCKSIKWYMTVRWIALFINGRYTGSVGREREIFYLTTHSTHFIYGYMASDIWLRTILIVRKETRCRHIGYFFRLAARVLLYAQSHRQDSTYHGLCYTSRGALAGTRNSSMGPPHEGSIRRPIAPWANALPLSYVSLLGSVVWNAASVMFLKIGYYGSQSDGIWCNATLKGVIMVLRKTLMKTLSIYPGHYLLE